MPTSRLPRSTPWPISPCIRICAASRSIRRTGTVSYAAPAAIFVDEPRHYGAVPAIGERTANCQNSSRPDQIVMTEKHSISIICGNGSAAAREASDIVTAQLVKGLRATLFHGDRRAEAGRRRAVHRALVPGAAGVIRCRSSGPDGHPTRGGFLPPVPLPRRMWAGGELEFFDPLRVGDEVKRTSRISDVTMKTGSTGVLCFVSVEHLITTPRGTAIRERQDIVYRDMSTAQPAASGQAGRRRRRPQSIAKATWPIRCCCFAIRR